MADDECEVMEDCVVDLNEDENPIAPVEEGRTINQDDDDEEVEDDPFCILNRQTKTNNAIISDVDEDDDPFGIMKGESTGHSHVEENPFGLTEEGGRYDIHNEINLGDDEDPLGSQDTCVFDPIYNNEEVDSGHNESSAEFIGVGMSFDTLEECELLYKQHAKVKGFSVRRSNKHKNDDGTITLRRWVCSKEGYRQVSQIKHTGKKNEQRAITRVGCLASLRVKFEANLNKYVVKDMVDDHNHEVAKFGETQYLRSNRSITPADGALIDGMVGVGIKPAQIMDFFCKLCGGYENVGFTTKDLYNYIDGIRSRVLQVGDAQNALAYLQAKKDADPGFFFKSTKDASNRLCNLFWADGKARDDYAAFGDVIAFDTTYKTNAYRKPFVIFVGVNHHHQTTIFGCALLADETEETYCWVLKTFLEAMASKLPVSVLTDGDMAMRNAIEECFPGSRHRLCSWHLHQNAIKKVHKEGFCSAFQKCMATWYTEEEFEEAWQHMITDFELENNVWVADAYTKRGMWAEACLRGNFFAGMRSTQRSEGMNSYFNRFLKNGMKLYEFVRQFERAVTRLREREVKAECETNSGSPVMTTLLQSLEKHGAEIYTKSSFKRFRKELEQEALYSVLDKVVNALGRMYTLTRYCNDASRNVVTYHEDNTKLECSCQRFESNGIPCRHMMAVMKVEHMEKIPDCVINRRWCKNAKKSQLAESINNTAPDDAAKNLRYGAFGAVCNKLSYVASHSKNVFDVARAEIEGLTCRMIELSKSTPSQGSSTPTGREVDDPVKVKTKGRPSGNEIKVNKPRKCGTCGTIGHTRTHCPRLGKSPKSKTSKRRRKVKQQSGDSETEQCFVESKIDAGDEDLGDQWEFSTMPSP